MYHTPRAVTWPASSCSPACVTALSTNVASYSTTWTSFTNTPSLSSALRRNRRVPECVPADPATVLASMLCQPRLSLKRKTRPGLSGPGSQSLNTTWAVNTICMACSPLPRIGHAESTLLRLNASVPRVAPQTPGRDERGASYRAVVPLSLSTQSGSLARHPQECPFVRKQERPPPYRAPVHAAPRD